MKIKQKVLDYEEAVKREVTTTPKPKKPNLFFRTLLRVLSAGDLKATDFTWQEHGMERLDKKEPCLILMNHSSFIDLKIAARVFYHRPFQIVCTLDGFVGKEWLMRNLGCIPTKKFITDVNLVKDMKYAVDTLKTSILMYPEASYSFDGTQTPLPDSLGKLLKILKVPVIMVRTYGAFSRDPLYNNLQLRKVKVSADVTYLLSKEEIAAKPAAELNAILKEQFTFDNFRWQQENAVKIIEDFRADSLNRVLYKCPHCMTEGKMYGKGIRIACQACGRSYELTETGYLKAEQGEAAFTHIPDWYAWERECVRKELEDGSYRLDVDVDICLLNNTEAVYRVGEGHLTHTTEGFHLTGCDGRLDYIHRPSASYSLYADYYWYEIGDMICIGDTHALYYCFPQKAGDVVAKTRLAAEELFRMSQKSKTK